MSRSIGESQMNTLVIGFETNLNCERRLKESEYHDAIESESYF